MTEDQKTEYAAKIAAMSNRQLVDEAGSQILQAAVMAGFRTNDGSNDAKASLCYTEAVNRGNVDLYNRAFNSVVRSQGHSGMATQVSTPIDVGDPTLTEAAA